MFPYTAHDWAIDALEDDELIGCVNNGHRGSPQVTVRALTCMCRTEEDVPLPLLPLPSDAALNGFSVCVCRPCKDRIDPSLALVAGELGQLSRLVDINAVRTLGRQATGSSPRGLDANTVLNLPGPLAARRLRAIAEMSDPSFVDYRPIGGPAHRYQAWAETAAGRLVAAVLGAPHQARVERDTQRTLVRTLGRRVPMPTDPGPGTRWVPLDATTPLVASTAYGRDDSIYTLDPHGIANATLLAARTAHRVGPTATATLIPAMLRDHFAAHPTVPAHPGDTRELLTGMWRIVGQATSPTEARQAAEAYRVAISD